MNVISARIPSHPHLERASLKHLLTAPRKIRKPTALPFGTNIYDANGVRGVRADDGSWVMDTETDPVSTLDLAYPLTITNA